MSLENIVSAIIAAVVAAFLIDAIRSFADKVKKAQRWKKDIIIVSLCVILCVVFSASAAICYAESKLLFILNSLVVLESSVSIIILFSGYRRAFSSVFGLTQQLFEIAHNELAKERISKNT